MSQTQISQAPAAGEKAASIEEIRKRLSWVETPSLLEDFEKQVMENLTQSVWGVGPCKSISFIWDEYPSYKYKYLGDDVKYSKETHVDTLICDDHKYELEAEYEIYEIEQYTFIIHSFRVIELREKQEETKGE
jgi:hypothetical protein